MHVCYVDIGDVLVMYAAGVPGSPRREVLECDSYMWWRVISDQTGMYRLTKSLYMLLPSHYQIRC